MAIQLFRQYTITLSWATAVAAGGANVILNLLFNGV